MAKQLRINFPNVVPGYQLCQSCFDAIISKFHEQGNCELEESISCGTSEKSQEALNVSLETIGVSPIKLHGIPKHQRLSVTKSNVIKTMSKYEEHISKVYNVREKELKHKIPHTKIIDKCKWDDLDKLTAEIKEKLIVSDQKTKIQLLTFTPESWSRNFAARYFNITIYQIKEVRKLKKISGIFSVPGTKKGKIFSEITLNRVNNVYHDDEFTRQMPGKKDYVSIGRKQHMQKRLILCNLKELYVSFKTKYPQEVIGFSKFYSLRPKWCITVGASGTHSVCVCTLHQNAILLTNAIQIKCTYKDLMTKVVCDVTSNECMVHRCPNCPGIVSLKKFLDAQLIDNDEEVSFNQWQKTDNNTNLSDNNNGRIQIDVIRGNKQVNSSFLHCKMSSKIPKATKEKFSKRLLYCLR